MKLAHLSLILFCLLLSSCTLKPSGSTKIEEPYAITQEEQQQIENIAGKTETEQEEYINSMAETVSANSHIEVLEQELNETVILEENF